MPCSVIETRAKNQQAQNQSQFSWNLRLLEIECFFSTHIHVLKPQPQYNGIRMYGLWEVIRSWSGIPTNGASALTRETLESILAS